MLIKTTQISALHFPIHFITSLIKHYPHSHIKPLLDDKKKFAIFHVFGIIKFLFRKMSIKLK